MEGTTVSTDQASSDKVRDPGRRVPVVVVTDLYHPPEDPGDNFDLVAAYGLPEVDLRAIVLDAWDGKRHAVNEGVPGFRGPRDPGVIPVTQLNAVFGRRVPYGIGPFSRMRSPHDAMEDVPDFQQTGIDVLLRALTDSEEPVHVLSFGSARTIAVAYNRRPDLFESSLARLHLSAGTTTPTFMEWNVSLDPVAIRRVLSVGLPVSLYPCATSESCYAADEHNTYWRMETMRWIQGLDPQLRRYLTYALGRSARPDFLRAIEDDLEEPTEDVLGRGHDVWETAIWSEVTGRMLVRQPDGHARLKAARDLTNDDVAVEVAQQACSVATREDGHYVFDTSSPMPETTIFWRKDPAEYEKAMNEALPELYRSFRPTGWPH